MAVFVDDQARIPGIRRMSHSCGLVTQGQGHRFGYGCRGSSSIHEGR